MLQDGSFCSCNTSSLVICYHRSFLFAFVQSHIIPIKGYHTQRLCTGMHIYFLLTKLTLFWFPSAMKITIIYMQFYSILFSIFAHLLHLYINVPPPVFSYLVIVLFILFCFSSPFKCKLKKKYVQRDEGQTDLWPSSTHYVLHPVGNTQKIELIWQCQTFFLYW